ncbi:exodeoxyribonuclease V alpha subunit [Nocardioides thalensis]|uniref:RecBCD enzyme subunit RecD n=1 Tax=Nocardioides thalensis TaxID=1914755 RepID=A0A853C6V8_9ACTN|nr:exodeoxyribonuclease V subunit alpha [Nocardioides thalensis]NYJ03274.1 exodeoxyribonuclease V alpha subunit [Nocardioides thalensis]
MTELFEPTDACDHRLLQVAHGPLAALNAAGLLAAGDVRTAETVCRLGGEPSADVALAVALLVRAARSGSVSVDLADVAELLPEHPWPEPADWLDAVRASRLTGVAIRVEHDLVYLHRYWAEEGAVVTDLHERLTRTQPVVDETRLAAALDRLFPDTFAEQRAAAEESARRWTSVITGGPGTGKTTTLARLLAVLADQSHAPLRIALAAPTGKAAARMSQALTAASERRDFPESDRGAVAGLTASTLHRLLGTRPDNHSRFRHHRGNRLPHDVVVVDETSMVSLSLMTRLVEAIRPDARLVLLGDADQLASVEAGAVLHDVVEGFRGRTPSPVTRLETSHRFGVEIGRLAAAVRNGDADEAWRLVSSGADSIELIDPADTARIRDVVMPGPRDLRAAALTGDQERAIRALNGHRLLCAHREGPFGVRAWNEWVEQWLRAEEGLDWLPARYPGQPLIQTTNDYGLKLWNGDTGVVLGGEERQAVFDDGGTGRVLALSRLADVETAHALTVHRSQGSEFGEVTVVLPEPDSRLLTRQLLYTAVTRAVDVVRVVGTEASVREAVRREARRASGLAARLAARA